MDGIFSASGGRQAGLGMTLGSGVLILTAQHWHGRGHRAFLTNPKSVGRDEEFGGE